MPNAHEEINRLREEQTEPELPNPTVLSHQELINLDIPPTSWFVPLIIPNPGLVIVSGKPGSFKTWFALWIGLRVSAGLPLFDKCDNAFFDMAGSMGKVPTLFIEEEMAKPSMKERARQFQTSEEGNSLFYMIDDGFKFKVEAWQLELKKIIEEKSIKLLILDPFSSVTGLEDENSNSEASKVMDIIRKEFVKAGLTVVILHHPPKGDAEGESLRGAGDILGKCDVHLHLQKKAMGEEGSAQVVIVKFKKMRLADENKVKDFEMSFSGTGSAPDRQFVYIGQAKSESEMERDELTEEMLVVTQDGEKRTRGEIAKLVGQGSSNKKFDAAWKSLIGKKRIVKDNLTRKFYTIYPTQTYAQQDYKNPTYK